MADAGPLNTHPSPRLFTLPVDVRATIWRLVFDEWSVYKAGRGRRGYIGNARENICKTTIRALQILLTCYFAHKDCSPYLWSKAQVLYFNTWPYTKDFNRSLGDRTLSAGCHHIRSVHIVRALHKWDPCEPWRLLAFPALQRLCLGQLLLCRVPIGAESDLPTWRATSDGQEEGLNDLADELAMTPYHRSQLQRNDPQFFHLVETILRPSMDTASPLFAVSHGKHNGKRIIEVGRTFMLRGHQRQSPRGEKLKK